MTRLLGIQSRSGGARKPQYRSGLYATDCRLQCSEDIKRQRSKQDILLFAAEIGQLIFLQYRFGVAVPLHIPAQYNAVPIAAALLPHQPADLRCGKAHLLVDCRRFDEPQGVPRYRSDGSGVGKCLPQRSKIGAVYVAFIAG